MMGNANEHATTYIYDTVAVQGTISIDLNGITYAFAPAATSTCADTDMYCSGQMETLGVDNPKCNSRNHFKQQSFSASVRKDRSTQC